MYDIYLAHQTQMKNYMLGLHVYPFINNKVQVSLYFGKLCFSFLLTSIKAN